VAHDAPNGSATEVIDVHAHALPLPLLRALEADGLADLSRTADRIVSLAPQLSGLQEAAPIPFPEEQHDLQLRLAQMDAHGVHRQAVSAPPFLFGSESLDPGLTLEVTRRSNDALAEFVAGSGGRLLGLATLPVGLPGGVAELARCVDELGFVGATIGTYGGGAELDDPVNEELWAELAARQLFVLVHPSRASSPSRLADYHLVQLLGYPAETALAVSRLVLGGVMDRHDLVLCLAHGGGCFPAVAPRLNLGWHRKSVARGAVHPPTDYLARFRYDTAVFDPEMLRRLVSDVGVQRVLLGTDAPFDLADREPLRTVAALGLSPQDERAVLGGNAVQLLGSASAAGLERHSATAGPAAR